MKTEGVMTVAFAESNIEQAAIASQVIAATIEAGLIKADTSVGSSRKFARYLPFWA
jgi:hypothetical protein